MSKNAARARQLKHGLRIRDEYITAYFDNPLLNTMETEKITIKLNAGDNDIMNFLKNDYTYT